MFGAKTASIAANPGDGQAKLGPQRTLQLNISLDYSFLPTAPRTGQDQLSILIKETPSDSEFSGDASCQLYLGRI